MPETTLEQKGAVALEIKDAEKGEVEAVIATLGVVDRDGDVIAEGAIPDGAKVKMSAYGHDAVFGELPVGRGTLHTEKDRAVFRGKLFLSTARGREVFGVLKEMGADQEWSFGFQVLGSEVPEDDLRTAGADRILTKLDAFEVSPVLRGAGIGTRTVRVKQAQEKAEAEAEAAEKAKEEERIAEAAKAAEAEKEEEKAKAEADAKAAEEAAKLKALQDAAAAEFERFERTRKRLGV